MAESTRVQPVALQLHPNEASDLAAVPAEAVPEGCDAAYVTVLDEGTAEDSMAVLTHRAGASLADGWEAHRLHLTASAFAGRTEDSEACAFHGGHLYVMGSQFGSKTGPLQPKRAWVARLDVDDLVGAMAGEPAELEIARNPFGLHRAINDALLEAGTDVHPLGDTAREVFVMAALRRGEKKGKRWHGRVLAEDHPINVEGMAFAADGMLLAGLRYPVTTQGDPLIVALGDADALFDDPKAVPTCTSAWTLRCAAEPDWPLGIRGMYTDPDGALHAVVGSLDAEGKESALLDDRPAAGTAHCEHWRVNGPLPEGGGEVHAASVHDFPDLKTVEGLSQTPDGHFVYVVDRDDDVHLRFLMVD